MMLSFLGKRRRVDATSPSTQYLQLEGSWGRRFRPRAASALPIAPRASVPRPSRQMRGWDENQKSRLHRSPPTHCPGKARVRTTAAATIAGRPEQARGSAADTHACTRRTEAEIEPVPRGASREDRPERRIVSCCSGGRPSRRSASTRMQGKVRMFHLNPRSLWRRGCPPLILTGCVLLWGLFPAAVQAAPEGDATIRTDPFTVPQGQTEDGQAFCPPGTRVVGGGVTSTGSTESQVLVSGPLDETGLTSNLNNGDVGRSWYAKVRNDGPANTFVSTAICSPGSDATIRIDPFTVAAPGTGDGQAFCPPGTRVVGGGVTSTGSTLSRIRVSGPLDETGLTSNLNDGDVARSWYANVHNASAAQNTYVSTAICAPPTSTTPDGGPGTPNGGPGAGSLTLDLAAKKQKLKKKIKFFATASADSTLVARGKAIKEKTKELAANEKTKIKAKLKRAKRDQLANRLRRRARPRTKVKATATDQSGATATDKVKVKLKD